MADLSECFADETVTPVRASIPPLPDDGVPTTMEIVRAVKVIHDAYMKNCARDHAQELEATRRRLYRQPQRKTGLSLDL